MRPFAVFAALAISVALWGCAFAGSAGGLEPLSVETAKGSASIQVEIADDDAERERGLMFRRELAPDRGMLFIFDRAEPQSFWMRNTYIPLDIIYIGPTGRIVSIAENTTPLSEAPIPSAGPAQYVLELKGGRAAEIGARPGDLVRHKAIVPPVR